MLSPAAVDYSIEQLHRIAGLSCSDIDIIYGQPRVGPWARPTVFVRPAVADSFARLVSAADDSLDRLSPEDVVPRGTSAPIDHPVPVLFWGRNDQVSRPPFAEQQAGAIVMNVDIIAAAFFMLSRWEEVVVPRSDGHGRFPGAASVAYRQRFLDRPIVDEYALILRRWVQAQFPAVPVRPAKFKVRLTHDVDVPLASRLGFVRHAIGDVAKRHDISAAYQRFRQRINRQDPFLQGIHTLAQTSQQNGLRSVFYIMSAVRSRFDDGYDPTVDALQDVWKMLDKAGHEIGFHPGYFTHQNRERFFDEKNRAEAAIGNKRFGSRQHFLRFAVPGTWQVCQAAGLTHDATAGYADAEGFRCGTSHPFRPFDASSQREMDLVEIPLIAMDATLKKYRGYSPEQGGARIIQLAEYCRQVEGTFSLLWHNTCFHGSWQPWGQMYCDFVPHLAELQTGSRPAKAA
ncbi:MAG: polysaccharide deacetylase family protein [Pirellulales bacterium]